MPETSPERPHVLLIYGGGMMIPSVRLCGHAQMEALADMGRVDYRPVEQMSVSPEDMQWADIVLLGRLDSWFAVKTARRLRQAGKYLIYILDDDLLNVPESLSSGPHYAQPDVREHLQTLMQLSHAILSPSPILLGKYAVDGRRALLTEEPSIHPVPYRPHAPDAPIKIGFAGSVDRASDVGRILGDALREIKRMYGDRVQISFFGVEIPLARELNATVVPYRNSYDDYRAALNEAAWDIGLAPMPDAPFYACKHYNKFVEYAAAGIPGVFSDVEPYARLKREIGLGVFCENTTEAWVNAIRSLLDDRERRENLRREVSECAAGWCGVESIAKRLDADMADIWSWSAPHGKSGTWDAAALAVMRLHNRFDRVLLILRTNKWGVFPRAVHKLKEKLRRS